jgi:hypothetical protein
MTGTARRTAAPVAAPVTAAREREWNIKSPCRIFLDGTPEVQANRTPVNRKAQPERGQTGPQEQAERETGERRLRGPRLIRERRGRLVRHRELIAAGASCTLRGRIRGGIGVRASVLRVVLRPAGPARVRARA